MKKFIIKLLGAFIICICLAKGLYAASVNTSASSTEVTVGSSFTVYINVSGASFATVGGKLNISNSGIIGFPGASEKYNPNTGKFSWLSTEPKSSGTIISITYTAKSAGSVTFSPTAIDATDGTNDINASSSGVTVNIKDKPVEQPTQPTNPGNNNNNNTSTKSSNNYLSKLILNQPGLSPTFNKNTLSYSLTVGKDISTVGITATTEDSKAKVTWWGNTDLKDNENVITIQVTAENGSKRFYKINVNKSVDPQKANAGLASIQIDGFSLSPEFQSDVLEYDIGSIANDIATLNILCTAQNQSAKIEILGNENFQEGDNIITIKVTAQDGTTVKEYKIKFKKEAVEEQVQIYNDDEVDIYSLKDINKNGFDDFFNDILSRIKNNSLVILMFLFILVEFAQIVYLYRKVNKEDKYLKKEIDDGNNENSENNEVVEKEILEETTQENIIELENNNENVAVENKEEIATIEDKVMENQVNEEKGGSRRRTIDTNKKEDNKKRLLNFKSKDNKYEE